MDFSHDIVLVTHGAGELSAWVKPLAEAFSRLWPAARVTVVLTPSQYITGQEESFAKHLPGVHRVISRKKFWHWALWGRKPLEFSNAGLVMSLGGDLFYPRILGWRLRYPCYAYVEGTSSALKGYKKVFCRQDVGDLMVDSISSEERLSAIRPTAAKDFTIALLPGSRAAHIAYLVPYFKDVAKRIKNVYPDIRFVWKVSPFSKTHLPVQDFPEVQDYKNIDFALAIPGTNTAHLAICGIPYICVMPWDRPDKVPLPGLVEYVSKIPWLGIKIKLAAFRKFIHSKKYLALPNLLAKQSIIPELYGFISPAEVAQAVIELLKDKPRRQQMAAEIKEVMGPRGAAVKIVEELKSVKYSD
jgi:lipid-A-disaccharide synthase